MTNRIVIPALLLAFSLAPGAMPACPVACGLPDVAAHPDHGASYLEQLTGQWVVEDTEGKASKRIRFYDDGRFGFMDAGEWTAGSYVILRTDERQKGVLRLEFYVDGNLHLQEVRCEIYFTAHEEHHDHHHDGEEGHSHGSDERHGEAESQEDHHHEYLKVEVLPAAEHALLMEGQYLHHH